MANTPIPQPPGLPFLGNVTSIDSKNFGHSIAQIAAKYGEIFKLSFLGSDMYFLCSQRLAKEVCDESRFCKTIGANLEQLRNGMGDGLFTAYNTEHNWGLAHRILIPSFGPIGINNMFDEMYDVATQLVSKWARTDPDQPIHATDDYTRLTLDSIALCAMDKRFNSFYHEEMHPFVSAMTDFLAESGARSRKTRLELLLNRAPNRRYERNIAIMETVAQEVIDRRRKAPSNKKDLLNAMLQGKDPKTGEGMSDENIMHNMLTFLIAGHETTSGMLGFTTYYLLKNPETLQRAQQEIDSIVGRSAVKIEHLSKLPYIEACLRESLRLSPTAGAFSVQPVPGTKESVLLGGEYLVPANAVLVCFLSSIHRDPKVYGPDAEVFDPERMLPENFAKLPTTAWKPFGNGARGCIGRPFAWQEALLALAMILQNFNLRMADPSYQLKIKQTLTVKPDNFYIKVALRPGIDSFDIEKRLFGNVAASAKVHETIAAKPIAPNDLKPMTVLYGSNSGTCEGLAQKLALAGDSHGFAAVVKSLDSIIDRFPMEQPVVLIVASYEGLPPDNAKLFTEWLKRADGSKFKGAQYAVFGCGHKDWFSTYQKVPIIFDNELSSKGAETILPRGETNVAEATIFDDFDAWTDKLWLVLGSKSNSVAEGLDIELSSNTRASHLRHSVQDALVLKNQLLTPQGVKPEKRYVEFKLPTSATYKTGDYLALLPINDPSVVSRVLRRFRLPWDATMKLKKTHSTIPTEVEISVSLILSSYVELHVPATKKNIQTIAGYLGGDVASKLDITNVSQQSPLDIIEAHPDLPFPFAVYLSMLPPMRIRQYSISSSPLADPTVASITFSLAEDKSHAHPGVATHYLQNLQPGSIAQISIRESPAPFHPPTDPSTPLIMICAGTGIAPFRGFVQDRAMKIAASTTPSDFAPAVLISGCRSPEVDALHSAEFAEWEQAGAVKHYSAYSRVPELSADCKYAQDRMWRERRELQELFARGAKVFVCGSGALGKGITDTVCRMAVDWRTERGRDDANLESARAWWENLRNERYAVDVFD